MENVEQKQSTKKTENVGSASNSDLKNKSSDNQKVKNAYKPLIELTSEEISKFPIFSIVFEKYTTKYGVVKTNVKLKLHDLLTLKNDENSTHAFTLSTFNLILVTFKYDPKLESIARDVNLRFVKGKYVRARDSKELEYYMAECRLCSKPYYIPIRFFIRGDDLNLLNALKNEIKIDWVEKDIETDVFESSDEFEL